MNARGLQREPSAEDLRVMAYVDGELGAEERLEFEHSLAGRADLRREIARLERLNVLARHAAGPEPLDHEWRALAREPLQRAGFGFGFVLVCAGALALGAGLLMLTWTSSVNLALKLAASALALGHAVLFLATLRARLRTRHLDPYTDIER